jgi:hypothetical protein
MKIISLLAALLFACTSCNCKKPTVASTNEKYETLVIEYEANTRGFYQKLVVQNHAISSTDDRNGEKNPIVQKISDSDWNALIFEFNKVDLDGLPNLKAPTEKRFYDGAAIAGLKITIKGKTFETTNFDHGFPPMEIQKVVKIVNSLFNAEE